MSYNSAEMKSFSSKEANCVPKYAQRFQPRGYSDLGSTTLSGMSRQVSSRYSMYGTHQMRRSSFFDREAMQSALEKTESKLLSTLQNLNGLESNHANLQVSFSHFYIS